VDLREFDEPQEAVLHFELDVADGARRSFMRGVAPDCGPDSAGKRSWRSIFRPICMLTIDDVFYMGKPN